MYRYLATFALALLSLSLQAQEILAPIATQAGTQKPNLRKADLITLNLPFFDDFSYPGPQADPARWANNYVYINTGFARNARSVGQATFDAMDAQGQLYSNLGYYETYGADTLSSQLIDLSGQSNVVLSFLYQAGGWGEAPEASDLLLLQFYEQATQQWHSVWQAAGAVQTDFQEAVVAVSDARYLNNEFRFRFINYVSLGKDDDPSLRGNNDFWQLDMVYLDANRSATYSQPADMCFVRPTQPLLVGYKAVPWTHYLANTTALSASNIAVALQNNSNAAKNIGELNFRFTDDWGNLPDKVIKAGSYDLQANELFERNFPISGFRYESSRTDSAQISLYAEMQLDETDFYEPNNQIVLTQRFTDYYAYDDGSAESAYGIVGNASTNAQVAYRFTNYQPEAKLWGVEMYIAPTLDAANLEYFYLVVWADNNGEPGEILYQQPLVESLHYNPERNGMNLFRLHEAESDEDTAIVVGNSFFVGWEQTTEALLGIGFDRNSIANDKLMYNVSDHWASSQIEGALMMHPVFAQRPKSETTGTETVINRDTFVVYPNPAQSWFVAKLPLAETGLLQLGDASGRVLYSQANAGGDTRVELQDWPAGVYWLRWQSAQSGRVLQQRVLIAPR